MVPKIMEQMQQIGMGWDKEADLIGEAHKKNMFALEYAFTPEEARILAENGCPCISSHVGSTVGGMKGAKSKLSLDDAVELTQEVFDAALSVNPDIILFAHWWTNERAERSRICSSKNKCSWIYRRIRSRKNSD